MLFEHTHTHTSESRQKQFSNDHRPCDPEVDHYEFVLTNSFKNNRQLFSLCPSFFGSLILNFAITRLILTQFFKMLFLLLPLFYLNKLLNLIKKDFTINAIVLTQLSDLPCIWSPNESCTCPFCVTFFDDILFFFYASFFRSISVINRPHLNIFGLFQSFHSNLSFTGSVPANFLFFVFDFVCKQS